MIDLQILLAQFEFAARAETTPELIAFARQQGLDMAQISDQAGMTAILQVVDCGGGRFDWKAHGEPIKAFVFECLDEDGESTLDLAAWPLDDPRRVLTMFGRAPLAGMWEACNYGTYIFDKPLVLHRSPLDWMKAGCHGAAVITPGLAARLLIDLPGKVQVADPKHRAEVELLVRGLFDRTRIIVADRKAAA